MSGTAKIDLDKTGKEFNTTLLPRTLRVSELSTRLFPGWPCNEHAIPLLHLSEAIALQGMLYFEAKELTSPGNFYRLDEG